METLLRESRYVHVLHITRFAKWLEAKTCSLAPPYLLTMGGTDVHVDLKQGCFTETALLLLEQAKYITVFNREAKNILAKLNSAWEKKLILIPQAVFLPNDVDLNKFQRKRAEHKGRGRQLKILLPAGLRKVKDVLHLLDAWRSLAQRIPGLEVNIVGEALDREVFEEVQQAVKQHAFLHYHGAIAWESMLAMYRDADVVINTSLEEGQPTAICEAMALGIPVIVRDNPGNRSVVTHQRTGFIYQTETEFIAYIEQILSEPDRVKQMVAEAQQFMRSERGLEQEIQAYIKLLKA